MDKTIKDRVLIGAGLHSQVDVFNMNQLFDFLNLNALIIKIFQEQIGNSRTTPSRTSFMGLDHNVSTKTIKVKLTSSESQVSSD